MNNVIEFIRPDKPSLAHETHSIIHPEQDRQKVLDRMNGEWCEVNMGGKICYLNHKTGYYSGKQDLAARYSNEFITYSTIGRDGLYVDKLASLATEWLKWKDKSVALNGITFNLSLFSGITPCGHYNKWKGFTVDAVAGLADTSLIHNHILHVIAANDASLAKYVTDWIAYGFQHPSKPVGVALSATW
jgi:hypothetical protein